jgi:hypothetical protein
MNSFSPQTTLTKRARNLLVAVPVVKSIANKVGCVVFFTALLPSTSM